MHKQETAYLCQSSGRLQQETLSRAVKIHVNERAENDRFTQCAHVCHGDSDCCHVCSWCIHVDHIGQ